MKQRETQFKERVLAELRRAPQSWWVKTQQVSLRGTPDLLGCVNGLFVAIELKDRAESHIEPLQTWNLNKIEEAGGLARIMSRDNENEIMEEIQQWTTRSLTRKTK